MSKAKEIFEDKESKKREGNGVKETENPLCQEVQIKILRKVAAGEPTIDMQAYVETRDKYDILWECHQPGRQHLL